MVRKLAWLVVGVVLGVGVWGGVVAASSAPPQQGQRFTFRDHTVKEENLDNDNSGGFSAGDWFTFHDRLLQEGKKAGTFDGTCSVTMVVRHRAAFLSCVATAKLTDGQIGVQAAVRFAEGPDQPFRAAITGGTDVYRTARGYVQFRPIKGPSEDDMATFYILP